MPARRNITFETTRPVTGDAFYGRATEIEQCITRIEHGQSVLITGESRIGKTSLLYELRRQTQEETNNNVVDAELDHLMGASAESEFQRILELVKPQPKSGVKETVAFFNDFDGLLRLGADPERFGFFLKNLVDSGHTVVCGSAQSIQLQDFDGNAIPSPLVSFFREIPLTGLTSEDAQHLLAENMAHSNEEFTHNERDFVVSLAGTVPHRLQNIGFELLIGSALSEADAGERLRLLTDVSVEQTQIYINRLDRGIAAHRQMNGGHWQKLISIAHDNGYDEDVADPEIDYLRRHGFIASGAQPFTYQGTFFREVLCATPADSGPRRNGIGSGLARLTGVAFDTAVKTAVAAAMS